MLELTVILEEGFDEETEQFVALESQKVQFEHSLLTLSKWEGIWNKPFLGDGKKTNEEVVDYLRCMLVDPENVVYLEFLTEQDVSQINDYINSKQSAAFFADDNKKPGPPNRKVITADLIYYWMVALTIPVQCETWHLNKLLTLIRITDLENKPKKNMSQKDTIAQHRSLNAQRRNGRG